MNDLSIIIPIYNSQRFIDDAVKRIVQEGLLRRITVEILLCDDSSDDGSWRALELLDQQYDNVRVLQNMKNEGLGHTLRRLISAASSKKIVYCDIDLPFGEQVIFNVCERLDEADIIVASRYLRYKNYEPLVRKVFSRFYWLLCWLVFRIPIKDIGSGTVGFWKATIESLNLKANGFDFHAEFYRRACQQKLRISEIGFPSANNTNGSFSIMRYALPIFLKTFQLLKNNG